MCEYEYMIRGNPDDWGVEKEKQKFVRVQNCPNKNVTKTAECIPWNHHVYWNYAALTLALQFTSTLQGVPPKNRVSKCSLLMRSKPNDSHWAHLIKAKTTFYIVCCSNLFEFRSENCPKISRTRRIISLL